MNTPQYIEYILNRDKIICLTDNLSRLLSNEEYHQFKIRFSNTEIVVIPHAEPINISLRK